MVDAQNPNPLAAQLREKIAKLERSVSNINDASDELLREELIITLEELQIAEAALIDQNVRLRNVQKMLAQEHEKYSRLFALSPEGHVLTDRNGIIQETNLAFAKLLNFSSDFLLNQPLRDFIMESQHSRFDNTLIQSVQFGPQAMSLQPRIGAPISVEISMTPITGEHFDNVYLLWNCHDMRDVEQIIKMRVENVRLQEQIESQQLQAQLESEKAVSTLKSDIMVVINHGFRTPLSTIQTVAFSLDDYWDRMTVGKRSDKFKTIYDQVKRITMMLDNIDLVVHGVTAVRQLHLAKLNLRAYCRNLIAEVQSNIGQSHAVALEIYDPDAIVYVDKYLLDLILGVLINNAILYSPENGEIRLVITRDESDFIFQVIDQGIGIPLADQSLIFNSIHRGTNVGIHNGLGLGLKIAYECVNFYGGHIAFESQENKGSTFTVHLPALEPTES